MSNVYHWNIGFITQNVENILLVIFLFSVSFQFFFNYRVSQNKISFRKISWTCFIWLPNESFLFLFLTPEVLRQEIKKIKIVKYHKANFLGGTMYFYESFYIFLVCQFDPKVVPRSKGHNWNISLIALVLWNILKQWTIS